MGAVNAAAVVLGTYFMTPLLYPVLRARLAEPGVIPYLRSVLGAMALTNLLSLGVLLVSAIRFIQTRLSATNLYSLMVLLLLVYGKE